MTNSIERRYFSIYHIEVKATKYICFQCDNKKKHPILNYNFIYKLFAIQTGFVETLKPQFVPGQVMAGSAAAANVVEEKLSHLQLQQENENLKSQVNYH